MLLYLETFSAPGSNMVPRGLTAQPLCLPATEILMHPTPSPIYRPSRLTRPWAQGQRGRGGEVVGEGGELFREGAQQGLGGLPR